MSDAWASWRKCAQCGYLVPAAATECKKCGAGTDEPASGPPLAAPAPPQPSSAGAPPRPFVLAPPFGAVAPPPTWFPPATAILPPPPPPGPRRRRPVGAFVALLVAVATGCVGVFVWSPFSDGGHSYPASWDARLAPIVNAVQRIRGLRFKHPVPVKFLDDAALNRATSVTTNVGTADRRQLEDTTAGLRALGLLTGRVDLLQAVDTQQQSAVLAFYDPDAKDVVVRGTATLDAPHRVTLAHELTHVLQDQYFDLNALRDDANKSKTGSPEALRALEEGDAMRVQDAYLAELGRDDQVAYQRSQDETGQQVTTKTERYPPSSRRCSARRTCTGPRCFASSRRTAAITWSTTRSETSR